jgi:ABC-type multidrug transport system fused ATPase/permease subunit
VKTYLRLLKYLKPYIWPYFTLGLLCMIGFGATDGVLPFLIQRIMDDVFALRIKARFFIFHFSW